MDLRLQDKITLVAGSSRGIGFLIAKAFRSEGARVAVTGRYNEALCEAANLLAAEFGHEGVLACPGDLTDSTVITNTLERIHSTWGTIDCLVANIGTGTGRTGWELRDEDWDDLFTQNLAVNRRVCEAVLPEMVAVGRGSIIFISSIAGVESLSAPLPYSAAKAALISYSKNLARQLGPKGIRVNSVAPGNVLFPGGSWEKKLAERPEFFRNYIETEVPLQRFGTPEEIASVVAFLSSDRASFITGACMVADGGQTRSY
ncbi:MAG: SDR family NAD(P)-dependent oxidoreductase [Acidobacteriota bacterium]